ncbi:MAG: hypothetical protein FVQ85_06620 [Planctomycetes bacterium]|nr:hypothetical protein [Planctomycetota bacterium]
MFKKFAIPGLVLLIAGTAMLGWVLTEKSKDQQKAAYYKSKYDSEADEYLKQYKEWLQSAPEQRAYLPWGLNEYGKPKTEARINKEQQERLIADMDKLAAGKTEAYPFADILYGKNWRNQLSEYKKRREFRESVFTGSLLCTFAGGGVFTCCLLLWIVRTMINTSSYLSKSVNVFFRNQKVNNNKEMARVDAKAKAKIKPQDKGKVNAKPEAKTKAEAERKPKVPVEKLAGAKAKAEAKAIAEREAKAEAEKLARVQAKAKAEAKEKVPVQSDAVEDRISLGNKEKRQDAAGQGKKHSQVQINAGWQTFGDEKQDAVLISDEKSDEIVGSSEDADENMNVTPKLENSLKAQTENLQKQMAEFRQMAQGVQQTTLENSKPINNTLSELTQQVSAIREYAASQQGRLTKLQDGYDWNIMRTFCLRIIRSIDNLEKRISRLAEQNLEVVDLEEVRDEMLFALESSGVEQFEPEINSDYHGQEKYAEAVKDKECSDGPKMTGKIAKIIRPGYQYFIDEDNSKVVRPAQVKLFG